MAGSPRASTRSTSRKPRRCSTSWRNEHATTWRRRRTRVSWHPPRQLEHLARTKHGRLEGTARGFDRQRIPDLRQVGRLHLDPLDAQDDVAAEWNVAVAQVDDHGGASKPELLARRVLRHRLDDVA